MEEEKQTQEKKEPIVISYIKDRIHNKNKNFVMIFVGPTGSGKSYSALRLAEMLDPSFDISRVCFKAKDFMDVVNGLTESGEEVSGKVILWDEFGVEHNAREFMTISNRVINYFFQTSRHLNLIVLMSVPLLSFIDSATRKLCHSVAEMQGINTQKKTASVKVKMIQTNVLTGKEYPKYLRYKKNGKSYKCSKLKFKLPSPKILNEYEKKKKDFTSQLNKDIMEKLLKTKASDIFTDTQTDYLELYKKFKGNVPKIAEYVGTSKQNVYKHLRKARIREMNSINRNKKQNQSKLGENKNYTAGSE